MQTHTHVHLHGLQTTKYMIVHATCATACLLLLLFTLCLALQVFSKDLLSTRLLFSFFQLYLSLLLTARKLTLGIRKLLENCLVPVSPLVN